MKGTTDRIFGGWQGPTVALCVEVFSSATICPHHPYANITRHPNPVAARPRGIAGSLAVEGGGGAAGGRTHAAAGDPSGAELWSEGVDRKGSET